MNNPPADAAITLEGYLAHITFLNPENHYTVARLKPAPNQSQVTVVGCMPGINPGDRLRVHGNWESHPRFGQQLKVIAFEVTLPEDIEGIRKYLASGFIKGVGEVTVDRLIRHFEEKTLEIIETHPHRLAEVKGVGKNTALKIADSWARHHNVRHLIRFLQENGISTAFCARILKEYGADAVELISRNPYQIVNDIPSIGFYVADAIALNRGMQKNDPHRVRACVLHELNRLAGEGHTYAPERHLLARCARFFDIARIDAKEAAASLAAEGQLVVETANDPADEEPRVYLKSLHEAETGIADRLQALLSMPSRDPAHNSEQVSLAILNRLAIQLSKEQQAVIDHILHHRVAIITGGPGTGKTTLIRSINAVYKALGRQIALAAPTGRAAKRLSEVTGHDASTIHRLLKYSIRDQCFEHDQDHPIDADAVVIDEASMVDVGLMHHLLDAVHPESRLILVGDVFQLPPVGPGNVLADMIGSGCITTFELKQIFRQAQKSPIVLNAHRVRTGRLPDLPPTHRLSEFYFIKNGRPEAVVEIIVELCRRRIPENFHLDAMRDIQVLTPMHKGEAGTINLNLALQKALNPAPPSSRSRVGSFFPGDKVMHLKNNYQKDVFNGDIGRIKKVDKQNGRLSVDYEDRIVEYDFAELDQLTLAYAISVHKSQGSEYPAVVVPVLTQHHALLQRNLLYTAITRGKQLVVIVGTQRALEIALKNDKPRQRLSSLCSRLQAAGSP